MFFPITIFSQNLENIGKSELFKLNGGVGVNTIFYDGSSNREPLTYILSGNVNLNISGVYNVPFSFSYSNAKFQSNNPFSFNRLSMHPSYKWVTAHIGDVNMTFSPYTLSGHQFTGLGFDLSPGDKFKISVMYGRLLEGREYDENNSNGAASYIRMGYGLKTTYKFHKGVLGAIFFKAKDNEFSLINKIPKELDIKPKELDIKPKENIVISLDGEFKIIKQLVIKGEVAISALTEDMRSDEYNSNFLGFLMNTNVSTNYYKALKFNINYNIGKGEIGLGYERIDPNYKTLGGYFFNNDLENITVNASQRILKDKLSIAFNGGLQRDDLDNSKVSKLQRLVMSLNTTYNPSDKLSITGGYSSFQSFTNIKNQFDYINEISQIENELDKANISQISQNAMFNFNYILKDSDKRRDNLNVGFNYQDAVNSIDDGKTPDDISSFYNANTAYTINYLENNLSLSGALNVSLSKAPQSNGLVVGPTISANKSYFEKKLKVSSSVSYNQSINNGVKQGDVINLRLGARYTYNKKHNFNLNFLNQYRQSNKKFNKDFTVTFGYNYNFGIFSSKDIRFRKKKKNKREKIKAEKHKKELTEREVKKGYQIKFKYKDSLYQGAIADIDIKLIKLLESPIFSNIPSYKKDKLDKYRQEIAQEKHKKAYELKAIQYLKDLYSVKDYTRQYNKLLLSVIQDLSKDVQRLDYVIEKEYVSVRERMVDYELRNNSKKVQESYSIELQKQYEELKAKEKKSSEKLLTHRWILSKLSMYKSQKNIDNEDEVLNAFFKQEGERVFEMIDNKIDKQKIKLYLLNKVIDFYAKQSKKHIKLKDFDLNYMYKN